MSEPTPYWPPPPTTPIGPDLTPTHTELQMLRTYHDQHEIDALLDASFAARYHRCACGAMIGPTEGVCYPCSQGNRARGPIYGASLAGHTPVPGAALRAVEAVWLTPAMSCRYCAMTTEERDAARTENSDLARQVVALQGKLYEAQCALKRAEKGT